VGISLVAVVTVAMATADVVWRCRSASGTELMCCSWDGTVAYLDFSIDEIGNPMTMDEKVFVLCSGLALSQGNWETRINGEFRDSRDKSSRKGQKNRGIVMPYPKFSRSIFHYRQAWMLF